MYTSERILGALVQILKSKSLMSLYKRKISELLVGQYIIKQNISKINILLEKKQVSYKTSLLCHLFNNGDRNQKGMGRNI